MYYFSFFTIGLKPLLFLLLPAVREEWPSFLSFLFFLWPSFLFNVFSLMSLIKVLIHTHFHVKLQNNPMHEVCGLWSLTAVQKELYPFLPLNDLLLEHLWRNLSWSLLNSHQITCWGLVIPLLCLYSLLLKHTAAELLRPPFVLLFRAIKIKKKNVIESCNGCEMTS